MSAYLADNNHITYILESALEINARQSRRHPEEYHWYDTSGRHQVLSPATMQATGQMLREANVASIKDLYEDRPIQGFVPLGETLEYQYRPTTYAWDPVQVLKALECYTYQCCFRDDSPQDADRLTRDLTHSVIMLLPGYEHRTWGAAEPQTPAAG